MVRFRCIVILSRSVAVQTEAVTARSTAGRPEANYILERVIDEAARITGIDPVKLRRRNLIKPKAMDLADLIGSLRTAA